MGQQTPARLPLLRREPPEPEIMLSSTGSVLDPGGPPVQRQQRKIIQCTITHAIMYHFKNVNAIFN